MFLAPHTVTALWITTKVSDPLLVFVLAILSHFLLDIIPHGDEDLGKYVNTKNRKVNYILKVGSFDVLISIGLAYFYFMRYPNIDSMIVYAAILGAWLPDVLRITIEVLKVKTLYWYIRFHTRVHTLIDYRYPLTYGVPVQLGFTILMMKLIF